VACLIHDPEGADLYLMFNAGTETISFVLPEPTRAGRWRLAIDTAQSAPRDSDAAAQDAEMVNAAYYAVGARSSAILVST
jgi:pullulanase/glycogen debranching enzyme